jgi:hypothetical protein
MERNLVGRSVAERTSRESGDAQRESERDDDLHGDISDGFKVYGPGQ